jgi:hypothetical protein
MVGWLKNFVHSRPLPAPSLIKGYTIHMLARRAPTSIVMEYNARWEKDGADMADRGHLIYVSTLLARKHNMPGCGTVTVNITRRNTKAYAYACLPATFHHALAQYNAGKAPSQRFDPNNLDLDFWEVQSGTTRECVLVTL